MILSLVFNSFNANEAETIAVNEQESRRLHDQRTADVVFASAEPDHVCSSTLASEKSSRIILSDIREKASCESGGQEDETEYLFEFAVTRQALWELEFEEPVRPSPACFLLTFVLSWKLLSWRRM
ncbi:hypothetical protein BT69DRAFT_1326403 [Atractiella rhizophila]|nr:hypothetical protein BT69DRAFT_1326403 [Atractiella rhizophila]